MEVSGWLALRPSHSILTATVLTGQKAQWNLRPFFTQWQKKKNLLSPAIQPRLSERPVQGYFGPPNKLKSTQSVRRNSLPCFYFHSVPQPLRFLTRGVWDDRKWQPQSKHQIYLSAYLQYFFLSTQAHQIFERISAAILNYNHYTNTREKKIKLSNSRPGEALRVPVSLDTWR